MLEKLKAKIALGLTAFLCLSWIAPMPQAHAVTVRLKDITHIKGVRDNQLVGYGIVVGLQKTGDKSRSTQTAQRNLLLNFGSVIQNPTDIKNDNAAAVIVTALVPPFAKAGDKLDITVSSMNDAKSLEGGVLVQTQLIAPNGEVVALAQGPISTGGVSVEAGGSSKRTAITTSGRVPNGAIIERDIQTQIGDSSGIEFVLNHADYTMANMVADTITKKVTPAVALDGGTIRVELPGNFGGNRVPFIAAIENLEVNTNADVAKVIINERTGTIVIGNAVRLLPAAVAHGGITVSIEATNEVSQPNPLSSPNAATLGFTNAQINIEKHPGSLIQLKENASLQDLVGALNAIGVTPNDLISILQALKAAGSLEAELQII
jgi:flagellar P-ring protein FlgI